MAPRAKPFLGNPIELHTNRAMRVLGSLIERWCLDPGSRPASARLEADGRIVVFSVEAFRQLIADLPEADRLTDDDLTLRENIREIELILRTEDRLSLLLPEPAAMSFQRACAEGSLWPCVRLPSIYWKVDTSDRVSEGDWHGGSAQITPDLDDAAKATYLVVVAGEGTHPLDGFIHPYMAAYACAQCS
jgi:hypothetical protein